MCVGCCRYNGGCELHKVLRGRRSAQQQDDAPAHPQADSGQPDQPEDEQKAEPVVNAGPALQAGDANAEAPPPWLQTFLTAHAQAQTALVAQLQAQQTQLDTHLRAFALSMQSLRPPHASPPNLPAMPLPAGSAVAAANPQPSAGSSMQPHLGALGYDAQVLPTAHIHHNHYSNSGDSTSIFLGNITGGLAPAIPGQDGPSLEQLLTRNFKTWQPYKSDAEMKEALSDWLEKVMEQLTLSPDGAEKSALRALVNYITTTRDYVTQFGHKLAHQYHKLVLKAINRKPPYYDPAAHGPVYSQAYMEVLASATSAADKRSTFTSAGQPAARRSAASAPPKKPAKRSHTDSGTCDVHPTSGHSNSECHQQRGNKRQAKLPSSKPEA